MNNTIGDDREETIEQVAGVVFSAKKLPFTFLPTLFSFHFTTSPQTFFGSI
jgi:hypothetical protein